MNNIPPIKIALSQFYKNIRSRIHWILRGYKRRILHNPPEGDRMDVVLFRENRDLEGVSRPYLGKEGS